MGGDCDVHDTAAMMRQHDQDEEEPIRRGWHDEEIGGDDLVGVIREERAPGL